jgi:hypothetical protein
MMRYILAAMAAAFLAAPARAQLTGCQLTTGALQLQKVRATASGTQIIGCINASFDLLSSTASHNSTGAVHTADWLQVRRISGVSTGTVAGTRLSSAVYQDEGFYFTTRSSMSVLGAGGLGVTYGIAGGSVTATAFSSAPLVNVSTISAPGMLELRSDGGVRQVACSGTSCTAISSFTANESILVRDALNVDGNVFTGSDVSVGDDLDVTDDADVEGQLAVGMSRTLIASTATAHVQGNVSITGSAQVATLKFNDGTSMTTASSGATSVLAKSTICVTNALVTASTVIPRDDTIPQNTEGDEVLTCSITPTSASNRLRVTATGWHCSPSTGYKTGAIFRDTTANALKAADIGGYPADNCSNFSIVQEDAAAATSATTYKLRIGPSSALNIYVNGIGAARLFGGVGGTSIQIDEIVP